MQRRIKLICLTGIDGSGKTTLGKKITAFLQDRGLPALYVYSRFSRPIIFKPVQLVAQKIFLTDNSRRPYSALTDHKRSLFDRHPVLKRIFMAVLLLDYCAQLSVKVTVPVIRHKIVVCDRYIYDTLISDMAVDMNLSNDETHQLTDKCLKLVPKPSISFLLDVDEQTAFLRKTDTSSVEYLKDRRAKYVELANHYDMHVLDANRSMTDVYTDCINIIQGEFSNL